jgi:hypothetical protein
MESSMGEQRQGRLFAGAILVLLGLGLFALQFVEGLGDAVIFFLIGGAFVAGYLYRRAYGLVATHPGRHPTRERAGLRE